MHFDATKLFAWMSYGKKMQETGNYQHLIQSTEWYRCVMTCWSKLFETYTNPNYRINGPSCNLITNDKYHIIVSVELVPG